MKPYSVDFRQKIIEIYEQENLSIRKLAQRFGVAKSFIQKLLKQYRETGNINPQPQGGSPPVKLSGEHLVTLMEIIERNNDATLEELCDLLEEKTRIRVSRATMGRMTQNLNYSVKKKPSTPPKRKAFIVQRQRVEYWEQIREIPVENLIFVDESGVNLAMVRLYARALKGERARGKKPQKRGKNLSLISALSSEQVVVTRNIYGTVDGITFEANARQRFST